MIYLWTNLLGGGINWCFLEPKIGRYDFIRFMCREYFLSPSTLTRPRDGGKMQECNIDVSLFDLKVSYECREYKCYTCG